MSFLKEIIFSFCSHHNLDVRLYNKYRKGKYNVWLIKQSIMVCPDINSCLMDHRSSVSYSWRKLFGLYFKFRSLGFTQFSMKAVLETSGLFMSGIGSDCLVWDIASCTYHVHSSIQAHCTPCIFLFFFPRRIHEVGFWSCILAVFRFRWH